MSSNRRVTIGRESPPGTWVSSTATSSADASFRRTTSWYARATRTIDRNGVPLARRSRAPSSRSSTCATRVVAGEDDARAVAIEAVDRGVRARVEARARVQLGRRGAETMWDFARGVFARRWRRGSAVSTVKGMSSRGGWQAQTLWRRSVRETTR